MLPWQGTGNQGTFLATTKTDLKFNDNLWEQKVKERARN